MRKILPTISDKKFFLFIWINCKFPTSFIHKHIRTLYRNINSKVKTLKINLFCPRKNKVINLCKMLKPHNFIRIKIQCYKRISSSLCTIKRSTEPKAIPITKPERKLITKTSKFERLKMIIVKIKAVRNKIKDFLTENVFRIIQPKPNYYVINAVCIISLIIPNRFPIRQQCHKITALIF